MASAGFLWLLLLVPLLLQIPLLVYLVRRVKIEDAPARPDVWSDDRVEPGGDGDADPPAGSGTRGVGARTGDLTCRYCGAVNDASYRFCGGCAGRLR